MLFRLIYLAVFLCMGEPEKGPGSGNVESASCVETACSEALPADPLAIVSEDGDSGFHTTATTSPADAGVTQNAFTDLQLGPDPLHFN